MKRTRRVLFIAFYIAATIAVTGHRSARMAGRVEHTKGPASAQLKAADPVSLASLPNFGHSKKAPRFASEAPLLGDWIVGFDVGRLEVRPRARFSPRLDVEPSGARAPPISV